MPLILVCYLSYINYVSIDSDFFLRFQRFNSINCFACKRKIDCSSESRISPHSKMEAQKYIHTFEPYVKEANYLIDAVINSALDIHKEYLNQANTIYGQTKNNTDENIKMNEQIIRSEGRNIAPNIEWLTGEDFTVESGKRKIDEFLEVKKLLE